MKKRIKLLLPVLMLAVLVVGCADKKEKTGTTLQLVAGKEYIAFFEKVAEDYVALNPSVTINIIEGDMFTLLDTLPAQQGNAPDILILPNDRIGGLADQKLIAPIEADLSLFTKNGQKAAIYEGNNYIVPFKTDTTLLMYNKALTTEVPTTLNELDPADFAFKLTDFYHASGLYMSMGGYIFGDTIYDLGINNEGSIAAGAIIQDLYSSGLDHWELMKDDTISYDIMVDAFTTGKVKYVIDGPWKVTDYRDAGIDLGIAVIPSWDGTAPYSPLSGVTGLAANANSKSLPEVQKFLNFIADEKYAQLWYELTTEVTPHTSVVYEDGSMEEFLMNATSVATPMPTNPEFAKIWEPMADAAKQIATGKDVKTSLDAAAKIINDAIVTMNK